MSASVQNFKPSPNFERQCLKELNRIRDEILKAFSQCSQSASNVPGILQQIADSANFQEFTKTLAKRFFARCVNKNNDAFRKNFFGRAHQIFKGLFGDQDLAAFIQGQIEEKANLFNSIPVNLAKSLIPHVNEWALEGRTSKGIFQDLAVKLPALLDFQIRRIARTEISKTLTDITQYKCDLGDVPIYQWKASGGERGDGRTRNSHRKMANVLVFWGDPPAPEDLFPVVSKRGKRARNTLGHYHAGCCPNCRCVAMPVVSISDIEFPAKIYMNGAIRKIGKRELADLLKIEAGGNPNGGKIPEEVKEGGKRPVEIEPPPAPTPAKEPEPVEISFTSLFDLKKKTADFLSKAFEIEKENIFLDDFDQRTVQEIKDAFSNLKKVQEEIRKKTGNDVHIWTLRHLGSFSEMDREVFDPDTRKKTEKRAEDYLRKNNPQASDAEINRALRQWMKELEKDRQHTRKHVRGVARRPSSLFPDSSIGIYINPDRTKEKDYKEDDEKWNPPGCNNLKGTINHEIGHSLDYAFGFSKEKEIQKIFKEDLKRWEAVRNEWYFEAKGQPTLYINDFATAFKIAKEKYEAENKGKKKKVPEFDFLSRYAFDNKYKKAKGEDRFHEFIAEATSEILTVGYEKARPTTKRIWDEMLKVMEKAKPSKGAK